MTGAHRRMAKVPCKRRCVLMYIWEKGSRMSNELDNGGCMSEDGKGAMQTKVCVGVCVFVRVCVYVCVCMCVGVYMGQGLADE